MPTLRTYHVFISHCWEYNANYHTLVDWFDGEPRFDWRNLSVSDEAPMREDKNFERRLRKRLGAADIMVVIVGMEIAHRHWMAWEIKWARIRRIPILGVMPNGAERVPKVVLDADCPIVRWRRDSVVGAIRQLARDQR
jgi:hypothetical protein